MINLATWNFNQKADSLPENNIYIHTGECMVSDTLHYLLLFTEKIVHMSSRKINEI